MLSLFTFPLPFHPIETTIKASVLTSSHSSASSPSPVLPHMLPPQRTVSNKLFQGKYCLICWPYCNLYFLLIHYILKHRPCTRTRIAEGGPGSGQQPLVDIQQGNRTLALWPQGTEFGWHLKEPRMIFFPQTPKKQLPDVILSDTEHRT